MTREQEKAFAKEEKHRFAEKEKHRKVRKAIAEEEQRLKAIAALAPHQVAALRAVATSNGLDEIDAFTFDVLARIGLLKRPSGSKRKRDWQLMDEGCAKAAELRLPGWGEIK